MNLIFFNCSFYEHAAPPELRRSNYLGFAATNMLLLRSYEPNHFTLYKSAQLYLPCTTGPFISKNVGLALAAVFIAVASQVNTGNP